MTDRSDPLLHKYEVTLAVAHPINGIDTKTRWTTLFWAEDYAHAEEQALPYCGNGEIIFRIERYF